MKSLLKKCVGVFWLLCAITILLPNSVHAATPRSGSCGTNAKFVLSSDGTLTISGTGSISSRPWYDEKYTNEIKKIVINNGITEIGDNAFYLCEEATSISIPSSITSIKRYAISVCTKLTSISVPDSVTNIEQGAFYRNRAMTFIKLPNRLNVLNKNIFFECDSLTDVTIPSGVTRIEENAFYKCISLRNVNIPSGVTYIGHGAFWGSGIESIAIPSGATFSENVFSQCHRLKNVTMSQSQWNSIAKLGSFFYGTPWKMANIPDSGSYGDAKWSLSNSTITVTGVCASGKKFISFMPEEYMAVEGYKVVIADGITEIGYSAFRDCTGLKEINIPDSVTVIEDEAFANCTSLTQITLPKNLKEIKGAPFYNAGITSITIPYSVEKINNIAFEDCNKLKTIYVPCSLYFNPYRTSAKIVKNHAAYKDEIIDKASCCSEGKKNKVCLSCDKIIETVKIPIDSSAHTVVIDAKEEPTCTKDGKTEGKHCSACKKVLVAQTTIKAPGHKEVIDAGIEATCTKEGKTAGKHCTVCGEKTVIQTTVNSLNHLTELKNQKAATYFEKGYTGDKVCKRCNAVIEKGKAIAVKKLAAVSSLSLKSKKAKNVVVSWKVNKAATGYQIEYKLGKQKAQIVKIKNTSTKNYTIKNLKSKKKYQIRIRAYKTAKINGKNKTVYSAWSGYKSIKCK